MRTYAKDSHENKGVIRRATSKTNRVTRRYRYRYCLLHAIDNQLSNRFGWVEDSN